MTGRARLVAGIDSSTQQTKLVVVDAQSGELVRSSALPHPDGTELDPVHWWSALHGTGGADPKGVEAMSVTAQQHTTIFLDEQGASVRPALLWNDLRATASGMDLRRERGEDSWLSDMGLLPDGAHPVSKLRWLAEHEPDHAARVATVVLPHDWLTWRILGAHGQPTTDRSDASATGYWSPITEDYRPDLARHALGHEIEMPAVLGPGAVAGRTSTGVLVAAGSGDNGATHLALDTRPGDLVISIGTSTTVSLRTESAFRDPHGTVDTMADPRGGFIAIVAMLNGARTLSATARMLNVGLDRLDRLAAEAAPDGEGLVFVPYLDGERNPFVPSSAGGFFGLTRRSMAPAAIARASILGLACAIADAVDALAQGTDAPDPGEGARGRVLVVGGGARASALRQAIADLIDRAVEWPEHREHAAFGAAKQAAWALAGEPPQWREPTGRRIVPQRDRAWAGAVRERYATAIARH